MGSKQDRQQAQSDALDSGSLAEVREILFGRTYREMQQEIAELHRRWQEERQSWRDSLQQQHTALESTLHAEVDHAAERLSKALVAQAEQIQALSQSLESFRYSFDATLRKLESRIVQAHESLQEEIQDELRARLNEHVKGMELRLADELQAFRREERRHLSDLFGRFADDAEPDADEEAQHNPETPWRRGTGS